ncbi:MAG: Hsp20/alpha crystallin family protein [Rhizomicrobium sp.]
MAQAATSLPVKTESKGAVPASGRPWYPFESLRREVDRLFEDFDGGFWRAPFRSSLFDLAPLGGAIASTAAPAVDIAEKDGEYEITAELPGIDEKDIEVKFANGGLTIRGEKKVEKEESKKGYRLSERRYGAFERFFAVPEGIDEDKISAKFAKGVLTVTLPKTAEAQKHEKKIAIKAG